MRQIRSARVVPPQPPVPCGGRPLFFMNVRVRRRHRDLEGSASAVGVAGRQVCSVLPRASTDRTAGARPRSSSTGSPKGAGVARIVRRRDSHDRPSVVHT